MKKICFALLICLINLNIACSKKPVGGDSPTDSANTGNTPAVPVSYTGLLVALTNNTSKKIEIYDPVSTDWNLSDAKKWSWAPTVNLGFSADENSKFGGGTDFKPRKMPIWQNADYAAISDNSFAAIIEYPSGVRKWSKIISGNLHSAELLPNGNIALAASDGNWIRVYASSQGPDNNTYAEYTLLAAHAVLWDPDLSVLWVTGQDPSTNAHILTALAIAGTDAKPELTEVITYRKTLPTAWGHEIGAYYGNKNLLWVTSNGGEYVFNKTTKSFSTAPTNGLTFVKGIINQPSGQIVLVRPDANKNPRPAIGCTLNDWSTSTIDFYAANGQWQGARIVNGACFYKLKLVNDSYQ